MGQYMTMGIHRVVLTKFEVPHSIVTHKIQYGLYFQDHIEDKGGQLLSLGLLGIT
jgi:hypothetical protein